MAEVLFRPSSMDRIIACPPSVLMSRGMPKRAVGQAARDGSAAHMIAELCLKSGQDADAFIDRGMDIGDGRGLVFLDEYDCLAVQVYIDYARKHIAIPNSEHHIEYKLSMAGFSEEPLLQKNGGTADLIVLDWDNRILYVDDLKFGKGVMVRGDSAQLKDYALMAALTFPHPQGWAKIVTTIIQPRAEDEDQRIKPVEHRPDQLQDFFFEMYEAFVKSQDPNTPLNPGEKQCLWCDGKGRPCPAIAKRTLEIARTIFKPVTPAMLGDPVVTAPEGDMGLGEINIAEATPAQLAAWKEKEPLVEAFFKGISERMAALATAGIQVPGWKMVSRAGNRKWKDEVDVPSELTKLGLREDQIYGKPKLLGPAPIEKLLSAAQKKQLESLYEKPLGAPTLVKDSDSRGALPGVFNSAP